MLSAVKTYICSLFFRIIPVSFTASVGSSWKHSEGLPPDTPVHGQEHALAPGLLLLRHPGFTAPNHPKAECDHVPLGVSLLPG